MVSADFPTPPSPKMTRLYIVLMAQRLEGLAGLSEELVPRVVPWLVVRLSKDDEVETDSFFKSVRVSSRK